MSKRHYLHVYIHTTEYIKVVYSVMIGARPSSYIILKALSLDDNAANQHSDNLCTKKLQHQIKVM